MPEPCRRPPPMHPLTRREAERLRGGEGPGRGSGPQASGQAGGSDRVADEEGQAEPQGLQDLHLLNRHPGAKAARRAMCPWEAAGRWIGGGQAEGQEEEGGGAGDAGVAAEPVQCLILKRSYSFSFIFIAIPSQLAARLRHRFTL
jgi:hypothetical protein